MTTYEILMLLDPEQAEARQDEIVARARDLVEKNGGSWQSHDAWGRRRLAYPIAHKEEGVYHLVVFDAEGETLDEISRVLKIDDAVLRHLATRHIAGSRTSAPRDEATPCRAPAARRPRPPAPAELRSRRLRQRPAAERRAAEPDASETAVSETPSRSTLPRKSRPAEEEEERWQPTSTASYWSAT